MASAKSSSSSAMNEVAESVARSLSSLFDGDAKSPATKRHEKASGQPSSPRGVPFTMGQSAFLQRALGAQAKALAEVFEERVVAVETKVAKTEEVIEKVHRDVGKHSQDINNTVPLQMIEFNLILKAAKAPIGADGFWRLLIGTVAMLAFGYAGESGAINAWIGFFFGMCGWAFILFEIFAGESSAGAGKCSDAVKQSFNNMRIIVSVGWAIYPAGYFLGQVNRSAGAAQALNVTYNIADFVNKIGFVLACWSCAKVDTEHKRAEALLA